LLLSVAITASILAPVQAQDAEPAAGVPTFDEAAWGLVRVDVPDHPEALISSGRGSMLAGPPSDGVAYRPVTIPEVDTAYVAWEAVDALQTQEWVEAGHDGSGVRVAVFDVQWFNAALRPEELGDVETWDCGAHDSCEIPMDTLRPWHSYEEGSHGVACAETIRDLAPGVELHLVRVNGLTTLENAVGWAIRHDVDLISMSMSMFSESFYDGTGAVNELMGDLAANGVLMVTSAGNYADEHWVEDFRDDDLDGWHEFGGGSEYLPVYLNGPGRSRFYVNWDQYHHCGDTDLDVYVWDASGDLVGRAEERQSVDAKGCHPSERVSAYAAGNGWHYLQMRRAAGDPHVRFSVFARGSSLDQPMAAGSIADPGTHPSVYTVGAVRATNYIGNSAEYFSSQGPTHGGLHKPDIAGPDGLSSSVYGATGFYGTSASTPAVTAALAILMSADPELDPYQAADRLDAYAQSTRATFDPPDSELGAGYARLPPLQVGAHGCGERPLILPVLLWWPLAVWRRRLLGCPPRSSPRCEP
jgi:hypothetical protein